MLIHYALVSLFAPVLGFLLLAISPSLRRQGLFAGAVSCLFAILSLVAALGMFWGLDPGGAAAIATVDWLPHDGQPMAQLGLQVDGISASMAVVT